MNINKLNKISLIVILMGFLIGFSSCGEKLSDIELNVINKEIPSELYQQNSFQTAQSLYDYLFEGLQEYADASKSQVKHEIQDHRRSVAMFGDWDLASAIFGEPSTEEKLANKYNSYINYANNNRKKIYEVIFGVTEIIAKKPSILSDFSGTGDEVNLSMFSSLGFIPSSVSRELYNKYSAIPFNQSDGIKWGEAILPFSNNPSLQFGILTVAVIKMMKELSFPRPVYAVYNKDKKGWSVGYNTKQACFVIFSLDNDVENWESEEINYIEAYVNSKYNILNSK